MKNKIDPENNLETFEKTPPNNPDGINISDAYLKGVGMEDAQKAKIERILNTNKKSPHNNQGILADIMASLVNGISNVPDGLATSLMVGVNPIHGLYASIFGPSVGSCFTSSQLMLISATVASAVFAGDVVESVSEPERLSALFTLVFLTGIAMLLFGLLKFGKLMKYISYPVIRGFMYGVGLLLIVGQFSGLVGYTPQASNSVLGFFETLMKVTEWNFIALITALITMATMLILRKTPAKLFSSALALVVGTLFVFLGNFESVEIVKDISEIPKGLPQLSLPNLSIITPNIIGSAVMLAAISAIQGVGVSQMAENPDDSEISPSRDMIAQGVANISSGLFSGIPVGASIGSTALNMTLNAQSRFAGIMAGLWMLAIVLIFGDIVEQIPMPALTSLIMIAGYGAVNIKDSISILKSGWSAILGFTITLLCVLFINIPTAFAVGILLSILFYFISSASDIEVKQLIPINNSYQVAEVPTTLSSNKVLLLNVEGSLFFAGAQTFKELLPDIGQTKNPVVIIRMRNQNQMGATLIEILDNYAEDLLAVGGKLYLTGLDNNQMKYLKASGKLLPDDEAIFFPETNIIGESTKKALDHANVWVSQKNNKNISK